MSGSIIEGRSVKLEYEGQRLRFELVRHMLTPSDGADSALSVTRVKSKGRMPNRRTRPSCYCWPRDSC